jgi:hypothetical protein
MHVALSGSRFAQQHFRRTFQNRHRLRSVSSENFVTGDCHAIVSNKASDIANRLGDHVNGRRRVVDQRGFRVARPRRRSGHRQQLHATGHGHHRVWNLSAGDRRRIDRRGAAALRTAEASRDARSSSCAARSRCRSAGIPERKLRCSPVRHWGRDNSGDRRRRVPAGTADRPVRASAAVWYGSAQEPRRRRAATPARPALRTVRFAPWFRTAAAKKCLQKPAISPLS